MGTTRYVYNRALSYLKNHSEEHCNFQSLRNKFVTLKNNPNVTEWETETPKDIRAGAIKDLDTAFKAAFTNLKKGNITRFNLSFRSKKRPSSISIAKSALKVVLKNGIPTLQMYIKALKSTLKLSRDKALEKKGNKIDHDCRLTNENGRWFLFVPMNVPLNTAKEATKESCALDPGIRKFQTVYSDDTVHKVVVRKDVIDKLRKKISMLQSERSKHRISKSHYLRGLHKVQYRLSNLVDDMQYKVIRELTRTYKTIFIPLFESQEIVRLRLARKTKHTCLSLKHYTFRKRLEDKAKLTYGCSVYTCTEEYTSKTCGFCGNLNNVGSSETYKCKSCEMVLDRDVNGARNILIKCISENEKDFTLV